MQAPLSAAAVLALIATPFVGTMPEPIDSWVLTAVRCRARFDRRWRGGQLARVDKGNCVLAPLGPIGTGAAYILYCGLV